MAAVKKAAPAVAGKKAVGQRTKDEAIVQGAAFAVAGSLLALVLLKRRGKKQEKAEPKKEHIDIKSHTPAKKEELSPMDEASRQAEEMAKQASKMAEDAAKAAQARCPRPAPSILNKDAMAGMWTGLSGLGGWASGAKKDPKEAFKVFDKDGNGQISKEELKTVMKDLGHDFSKEQIDKLVAEVDTNNDGEVSYDEFVVMLDKAEKGKK